MSRILRLFLPGIFECLGTKTATNWYVWKRSKYIDQTQLSATIPKSFFLDFFFLVCSVYIGLFAMANLATKFRAERFYASHSATQRAAIGISACLTGEKVRYDGADKLITAYPLLARELNLIAICPEMGAGLGTPRPPVQLILANGQTRALGRENPDLDATKPLQDYAINSLQQLLRSHSLCGYLWKSRSPSCGLGSTPIFSSKGTEIGRSSGIQANYFRHHLPYINHCEETALVTESAALGLILRCRLVFDLLYANTASLPTLHSHYRFLCENFDAYTNENLQVLSEENDKKSYLTALLASCGQVSNEDLLELFR